jgi:trehalose 6-phosphate phosphatase
MILPAHKALNQLSDLDNLWLFLDYDGTLAEFAPSPDIVTPDPELITLLTRLVARPGLRLAVISGRRLSHIQNLIPIPGIWLAGTYGIELLAPSGEQIDRLVYRSIRPALDQLKPRWEHLTASRPGFYLEDKGWSLAIHARLASDKDGKDILQEAKRQAEEMIGEAKLRLRGGHKFLELCPTDADKGRAIEYILTVDALPGSRPVFIGDDDKDEPAFKMVKAHDGFAIVVTSEERPTQADYSLDSPGAVRAWLAELLETH